MQQQDPWLGSAQTSFIRGEFVTDEWDFKLFFELMETISFGLKRGEMIPFIIKAQFKARLSYGLKQH